MREADKERKRDRDTEKQTERVCRFRDVLVFSVRLLVDLSIRFPGIYKLVSFCVVYISVEYC